MTDLRDLLSKATPGPWKLCPNLAGTCEDPDCDYPGDISDGEGTFLFSPHPVKPDGWNVPDLPQQQVNAALIVAAVNRLPLLLDVRDALKELVYEHGTVLGVAGDDVLADSPLGRAVHALEALSAYERDERP